MRAKIINIMFHPPAYELYYKDPRPEISWDTPDGKWVGIWGYDWPDLIGKEILKSTDEFKYEVWQPDLRADKIYSYTFNNGLIHKLFPAKTKKKLYGIKFVNRTSSTQMMQKLKEQSKNEKLIINLHGDILLFKDLLIILGNSPIVVTYHGVIHLPFTQLLSYTKNIPSKLNHIIDHFWLKKNLNKIDYITYQNDTNINFFRENYKGVLQKVTMGCNFSFWQSRSGQFARKELGLPEDKTIFFTACNLTENKQINKLISVFTELSDKYNFLLIIAGHGTKEYENYLKKLSSKLLRKDQIKFTGYIRDKNLINYYNACDFFITVSKQEGGPISAVQAFACKVPVISTKTGNAAELMQQYNCGCLLDIYDHNQWRETLEEIFQRKLEIKPMDREIAKQHYDWPNIAQKFIDIYHELSKKYYP